MSNELSKGMLTAIRKKGKKRLLKNILKTLVFYAIAMTILLVTGSQSKLFNWEAQPVWFWGVFAILLIFPIWKFRLYEPFLFPNFEGTVADIKSKVLLGGKKETAKGYIDISNISEMGRVDVCTVIVKRQNRFSNRFVFSREAAVFAREYYQVGDSVYHPLFAKYPYNSQNRTGKNFCINCGGIGSENESDCSLCGVPFAKISNVPTDPEQ